METRDANQLRAQLVQAFPVRPLWYWLDWGACALLGWLAFLLACWLGVRPLSLPLLCAASLLLLHAAYFVHEIAHLRRQLPGFELAWTLFTGAPLMLPTFMVEPHIHHHARETYGTSGDPEYERVAEWSVPQLILSVLVLCLVPPLLTLRFAVIAPLSAVFPPLRKLTVARLSTLATNAEYIRTMPVSRRGKLQEAFYCVVAWSVGALVVLGYIPFYALGFWAVVTTLALMFNQARTNVAHVYESDGRIMTLEEQVRDSKTADGGNLLTDIVFPVGTRYHAVHHFAPTLPYHALPAAHRKLVALLGDGADVAHARTATFLEAQRLLFQRARRRNLATTSK